MAFLGRMMIVFLLSIIPLWADLVIEEVIENDSGDVSAVTLVSNQKSLEGKGQWRAAFMNVVLPGAGHYYLGDKKKGAIYLSLDVAALAALAFSKRTSNQFFSDSRSFAYSYGDVTSSRDGGDDYWRIIGLTDNQAVYNKAMENNRTFDKKYTSEADYWKWKDAVDGNSDYREEYVDIRNKAGRWNTTANIFFGTMILNRVVSFIDGRISAGRLDRRASPLSRVQIYPHYSYFSDESGATLQFSF